MQVDSALNLLRQCKFEALHGSCEWCRIALGRAKRAWWYSCSVRHLYSKFPWHDSSLWHADSQGRLDTFFCFHQLPMSFAVRSQMTYLAASQNSLLGNLLGESLHCSTRPDLMDVRLTLTLGTSPQDTIILISVVQYSVGLSDISRIRGGREQQRIPRSK